MTSRLASLLVQESLVAPKSMADAFQRQVIYGGRLDTILLEMKAITEPQLYAALAKANALPVADAPPQMAALEAAGTLSWFDAAAAERLSAVPLFADGSVVRVLVLDAPERRALDTFGHENGKTIEPFVAPEHRFVQAVGIVYGTSAPARFQSLTARIAKRSGAAEVVASPLVTAPVLRSSVSSTAMPVATRSDPALRAIVTDLPQRAPVVTPAAPVAAMREEPTPRSMPRDAAAPVPVLGETAPPLEHDRFSSEPTDPLSSALALRAIDEATDRDRIFVAVCRGARSSADVVVLFTVQAETMTARLGLADRWIGARTLSAASLSLEANTPFRTATQGHAPLMAKLGEDAASRELLTTIGRRPPLGAALVPIVLRDRTVALLYADASGKRLPPSALADLSALASAASRAFQRLILAAKGRDYRATDASPTAKVAPREEPRGAIVAPGGWRSAAAEPSARVGSPLSEQQTQRLDASEIMDFDALIASVSRGDERARQAADRIYTLGVRGAEQLVARLPGPLRVDRTSLRGSTPPLEAHGPLLSLLERFGATAAPFLEPLLEDQSHDLRYYATLALGELDDNAHTARIGKRLFDRDADVRKVAVEVLRRRADSPERTTILESLRGELPGPERDRQRYAADALGVFGDIDSVPRLIELVKNDDVTLRTVAHRALVSITKQDFGTSRWRWRGWWDRHRNEPRVEWLFEGLVHSSDEIRAASAFELYEVLPETHGYAWDAPKRERDEAKRRWLEAYRRR
ncbi:MAG: hypothetical protein ABI321_18020 [Polyangia bacterium]